MITVLFQTESHYPANRKKIIAAITEVLESKIKGSAEVSVTVVGDRKMRQLNKSYRQIDATTDVLSFPQNDPSQKAIAPFVESPDGVLRLGDIVLSFPQIVAEAAEENKLVDDMMVFLALHGLDHLLGIHHPE